ncbi:hypothetical protein BOX15_Mlig030487g1 [Macrostomum lignano]|uniref:Protein xylosyltransferase n=2 Tax=Macrostomum lignano TaxID=282301 RepID=A0A1I8J6M7_9PLAT|nr:hypothetical protein BOX15_Mlig030487g1 [Macrostomum lignano]
MRCSLRRMYLLIAMAVALLLLYFYKSRWLPNKLQESASYQDASVQQDELSEYDKLASLDAIDKLRQSGDSPAGRVSEVSCAKLFAGNVIEQNRALSLSRTQPEPLDYRPDAFFAAASCQQVKQRLVMETLSKEEASFPLAFSILMFKDFYQAEKLFRAVYRPEHFYCLHVDVKSSNDFSRAASLYASCLDNVILASPRQNVQWGFFSVLEADLACMRQLLALSDKWRYFINLTGQEFPLRTMRELVRIVRGLNGANNVENAGVRPGLEPVPVQLPDGRSGFIRWYKGSVHVTVTRGFVQFAVSETGRKICDRLKKVQLRYRRVIPDETFFATLNHNSDVLPVPGGDRTGLLTDNSRHPFLNRYKNWMFGLFGYPCFSNKIVRQICIWGVQDLPAMNRRFELFVNKFYYNYQRFGLQCMEERFWNHTLADYGVRGYEKLHEIPLSFYTKFEFVRNHVSELNRVS